MLKMKKLLLPIIALTMCLLSSCEVAQQMEKMYYLTNCEFRMKNVDNVAIAGISLKNITKPEQFNLLDAAKLLSAAKSTNFPLSFNINVEGSNPNSKEAGLNRMDYIVLIDNTQMASGTVNQVVSIPANNGTANIPFGIEVNLKEIFKGQSVDAIVKFAKNLAGLSSNDSRISMKIKPYITVNNREISYPDYITLTKEFKGK